MSHADEVRALLFEVAKTLDMANQTMEGPLLAGLEMDYMDGLAARCRRYAEDLAAPKGISADELEGKFSEEQLAEAERLIVARRSRAAAVRHLLERAR